MDSMFDALIAKSLAGSGGGGGGGGTTNYNALYNRPAINGVTLEGDLSTTDLQITAASMGALPDTTKYAASSTAGGSASSAVKLDNAADAGATNQPVYFSSGKPTAIAYEINASVPADAVFTDTTYESKSAASGGTAVSLVTTGEKYKWNSAIYGVKLNSTAITPDANHNVNISVDKTTVGLSNVDNYQQVRALADASVTQNHIVTFGTHGYEIADSGVVIETSISSESDTAIPTSRAIASALSTKANTTDIPTTGADIGLGNVTNNAQVKKISSSVSGDIVTWNATTGDTVADSGKSFETTMTSSDTKVPTSKAVLTETAKKIAGLASGTNSGEIMTFGANGYTAATSGKTIETSLTYNSDAKVPTSKAVADYVAAQYPRFTYVDGYIAIDYGS